MDMPKDDDGYINLNGLIKELSINSILIHTKLWELYLSKDFKIGLNRTLDILKALSIGMDKTMPFKFNVDLTRLSFLTTFSIIASG